MIRNDGELSSRNPTIGRGFCLFAALFILVFGFAHRAAHAAAMDPPAIRLAMAAFCLAIAVLSYRSAHIRNRFDRYILLVYHLLSLYLLGLMFLNRASPDYVISLMILICAGSFGIRRHADLFWHSLPALLLAVAICLLVRDPAMDRGFAAASLVTTGLLAYGLTRLKMTERRETQKERQVLFKALETTSIGVTVTDMEGKILYSNPADAAMHGYTLEELIGKDARLFSPAPQWKPMPPESLREVRRWKREGINLRKDQSTFPVQLISDAIRDPEGEPIGMVTTCEDISERKQTEKVLREACARARALQQSGFPSLRMAVNLSLRQLRLPGLGELLSDILARTGLEPRFLEIELPESLITDHGDTVIETLQGLHALGIRISVDDFGKGNSSLGNLKHLPVDTIKIDESFVRDIETDANDAAIVTTMIALAHKLKMRVIAEAVETREQLEFLRARHCNEVQGHLFCRPLPGDEVDAFLRKNAHA